MSINDNALTIPGFGHVFHAPPNTPCPSNPLTAFTPGGTLPAGWENFGHTSKQNTVRFEQDKGSRTGKSTWIRDNVRYLQESSDAWRIRINALQTDPNTFDMMFNGELDATAGRYLIPESASPVERAIFVLMLDNAVSAGFYIPLTDVSAAEQPSISTTEFIEFPLQGQLKGAPANVLPFVNGKRSLLAWYAPTFVVTPSAWAATTAYALNATVSLSGGAVLKATTAGTSGSSAPTAPAVGSTVTDGTVVWTRQS